MPLTYDQLSAITLRKIIPKMVDNIFGSNPLLKRLKENSYMAVDGGTSISMPLNYAQSAGSAWYAGADTLDMTDGDVATAAEYAWKQLHVPLVITRLDELKNSGDSAKLKLAEQKVKIAEKTMKDALGTGLYSSGSDAKSIVGLGSIISTSNTVGGIAQNTYSWWAAQVDSSTTTLSLAAMQALFNNCSVDNDTPTVGMTTRTVYNAYYSLLQPQQRFQSDGEAKGGFSSLMFNGIPIIVDSHQNSGDLSFINEKYLHLCYHPDENMRFEPWQKPINQNVKAAHLYWAGALCSDNNRMHGGLTAITG